MYNRNIILNRFNFEEIRRCENPCLIRDWNRLQKNIKF